MTYYLIQAGDTPKFIKGWGYLGKLPTLYSRLGDVRNRLRDCKVEDTVWDSTEPQSQVSTKTLKIRKATLTIGAEVE